MILEPTNKIQGWTGFQPMISAVLYQMSFQALILFKLNNVGYSCREQLVTMTSEWLSQLASGHNVNFINDRTNCSFFLTTLEAGVFSLFPLRCKPKYNCDFCYVSFPRLILAVPCWPRLPQFLSFPDFSESGTNHEARLVCWNFCQYCEIIKQYAFDLPVLGNHFNNLFLLFNFVR